MAKKALSLFILAAFFWFEISCVTPSVRQTSQGRVLTKGPATPSIESSEARLGDDALKTGEGIPTEKADPSEDSPEGPSSFDKSLNTFRNSLRAAPRHPFGSSQTGVGAWAPRKPGPVLMIGLLMAAALVVVLLFPLVFKGLSKGS